jgi:hypothetical protein
MKLTSNMKFVQKSPILFLAAMSALCFMNCARESAQLACKAPEPKPVSIIKIPSRYNLDQVVVTLKLHRGGSLYPVGYKPLTITIHGEGNGIVEHVPETTFQSDGKIVTVQDTTRFTVDMFQIWDLLQRFYDSDFFVRRDKYIGSDHVSIDPDGNVQITCTLRSDPNLTELSIKIGEYTKTVMLGEDKGPVQLVRIVALIKKLAGVEAYSN